MAQESGEEVLLAARCPAHLAAVLPSARVSSIPPSILSVVAGAPQEAGGVKGAGAQLRKEIKESPAKYSQKASPAATVGRGRYFPPNAVRNTPTASGVLASAAAAKGEPTTTTPLAVDGH